MTPAPNQWHVEFDGLSYGPFTYAQMQGFVNEERVVASSLITPDPSRGYFQASAFPVFLNWLSARQEMQYVQQSQQEAAYAQQDYVEPQQQQLQQAGSVHMSAGQMSAGHMSGGHMAVGQNYTPNPTAQQMRAPALSVFLIMAEIRSAQAMPFLHAVQAFGTAQRIGDTVWLLRGTTTVEGLKASLSNTLTKQDRLFVLDCFNNETSWFNIGADMDTRIRELWQRE